jgi:hypothetical protein
LLVRDIAAVLVEVARFAGTLTALAAAAAARAVIRVWGVLALRLAGLRFLAMEPMVMAVQAVAAGLQVTAAGLVFWGKAQVEQRVLEQSILFLVEPLVAAAAVDSMVEGAEATEMPVVMAQSESSGRARHAHSHRQIQGTCK